MANETRGLLFEAIAEVALQRAVEISGIPGSIRWNEKPEGMSINPDFTIGEHKDSPSHVILVTASGSAKETDKKFWRNVGELQEVNAQLPQSPTVLNLYFKSVVKQGLATLSELLYDATLHVDQKPYCAHLANWVDTHVDSGSKAKEDKQAILARGLQINSELAEAITALAQDLAQALQQRNRELDTLWPLMRADYENSGFPPESKNTCVRRGLGKLMVLEPPIRQLVYSGYDKRSGIRADNLPQYAYELGFFKKSLVGAHVNDPEMKATLDLLGSETCEAVLGQAPSSMRTWIEPLRNLGNIKSFADCVSDNFVDLTTAEGMRVFLEAQHRDPYHGLNESEIAGNLQTAWMFDFIGALEKARTERSQGFGFAYLSQHCSSNREQIGNMDIGTWCSCFMNQYFNRLPDFNPPPSAVAFVSELLAEKLSEFSTSSIERLVSSLRDVYINTNLEKKLLSYRNFEPLMWLLIAELNKQGKLYEPKEPYTGWINEYASTAKRIATTPFVKVGSTLIHWKSAHKSHPNDKTKELSGRARSVKYQYHPETQTFSRRRGVNQLALIVDGDWGDRHLQTLSSSGWDVIVYPDQIVDLVNQL